VLLPVSAMDEGLTTHIYLQTLNSSTQYIYYSLCLIIFDHVLSQPCWGKPHWVMGYSNFILIISAHHVCEWHITAHTLTVEVYVLKFIL
jgi:hypothetical protein